MNLARANDVLRDLYRPAISAQLDDDPRHDYEWWRSFYAIPGGTIEVYSHDEVRLGEIVRQENGWWRVYSDEDGFIASSEHWDAAADFLLVWPNRGPTFRALVLRGLDR